MDLAHIGFSTYFHQCARIESRTEGGGIIHLDTVMLIKLLDLIGDRFSENAVLPRNSNNDEDNTVIQCSGKRRYKIRVDSKYLRLSFNTLMMLKRKNLLIKSQISLFEMMDYKPHLYNLFNHFCFETDERIVNQALHASHFINKEHLINEMCMLNCQCFDRSFGFEIMNNCLEWFVVCVPLFIKALQDEKTNQ